MNRNIYSKFKTLKKKTKHHLTERRKICLKFKTWKKITKNKQNKRRKICLKFKTWKKITKNKLNKRRKTCSKFKTLKKKTKNHLAERRKICLIFKTFRTNSINVTKKGKLNKIRFNSNFREYSQTIRRHEYAELDNNIYKNQVRRELAEIQLHHLLFKSIISISFWILGGWV